MTGHEPSTKEEIPPLCKETFITKDRLMVMIYVLVGILLSGAGTAVGWAMAANTTMTESRERIVANESRINMVEAEILKELKKITKER